MAKKTNSLIFRFGLSILWSSKSNSNKSTSNKIQLENLLCKELKKKKLKVLLIQYKKYNINIFVYNFLGKQEALKTQVSKYFNKTHNLEKIINKFGLSESLLRWFLKSEGIQKGIITKKSFSFLSIIILFYKKFYRKTIINILKIKKQFVFNHFSWFIKALTTLEKTIDIHLNDNKIKFKVIDKQYFRKVNGLLKFKVIVIYLETLIFRYCNHFLKIILNNILVKKGLVMIYKINKKYKQKKIFFIFHTFLLSVVYNNSSIITEHLAFMIQRERNHRKTLQNFTKIVEKIFFSNTLNFTGFQLRVSGKLNGKMRKSKYNYTLGKVQLQILKQQLSYSMSVSYTKFGILSVKIWLLNGNH